MLEKILVRFLNAEKFICLYPTCLPLWNSIVLFRRSPTQKMNRQYLLSFSTVSWAFRQCLGAREEKCIFHSALIEYIFNSTISPNITECNLYFSKMPPVWFNHMFFPFFSLASTPLFDMHWFLLSNFKTVRTPWSRDLSYVMSPVKHYTHR